jgi:TPR repeat protein
MSRRFPIAAVLWIVSLAVPAWADFQAGLDAANHKDYGTAMREWRPLAEQGLAGAQFNLGQLYHQGQGVTQDYTMARQWWEQAAAQGHAGAQYNLAVLYLNGQGVPQDYVQEG